MVCGVGPVEAAALTAAALAERRPRALLHVGIAGARTFDAPELVVGSEAVYCDADDPRWIPLRMPADRGLVEAARRAFPGVRVEPIGTSARVGGSHGCEVEAMEGYGVLRAAALAQVPALEVRALANAIAEPDRTLLAVRRCAGDARVRAAVAAAGDRRCLSCRGRCRPRSARSGR